jgi:hypothetical protein
VRPLGPAPSVTPWARTERGCRSTAISWRADTKSCSRKTPPWRLASERVQLRPSRRRSLRRVRGARNNRILPSSVLTLHRRRRLGCHPACEYPPPRAIWKQCEHSLSNIHLINNLHNLHPFGRPNGRERTTLDCRWCDSHRSHIGHRVAVWGDAMRLITGWVSDKETSELYLEQWGLK